MSEARNSAVNFPKFRKRKLTDPLPRPHTALVGGRQPAQRAKPVKSRLLSDKPPATVLKAPHKFTASLHSTWMESFLSCG